MTRYVFDGLFRFGFIPTVLWFGLKSFVRELRGFISESRAQATALAVGERDGCGDW